MVKIITIDSFKPTLIQFSHPGTLTPQEANRLTLLLVELLSDDVADKYFLKFISRFLTKDVYDDIIQERNINKLCGYPTCEKQPGRIKDTYSHSYQKSKMLPYSYLNTYCSKDHFQSSEFYNTQLSDEAIFARKDITVAPYGSMKYESDITLLEEVLDVYSKRTNQSQSILDIIKNLNSLSLNNKSEQDEMVDNMNQMLQDIKIVEKESGEVTEPSMGVNEDDEDDDERRYEFLQDQSKAIDGYVLQI